jgi:hypothetical protein
LMARWATSAQNLSAPLAVYVRASDGKMFIQARQSNEGSALGQRLSAAHH